MLIWTGKLDNKPIPLVPKDLLLLPMYCMFGTRGISIKGRKTVTGALTTHCVYVKTEIHIVATFLAWCDHFCLRVLAFAINYLRTDCDFDTSPYLPLTSTVCQSQCRWPSSPPSGSPVATRCPGPGCSFPPDRGPGEKPEAAP